MKLHLARYEEKLEKQEAHFHTVQSTLTERFERDRSNLLTEQKKRDQETSAMMQQTQSRFQVRFRKKRKWEEYILPNVKVSSAERSRNIKGATRECEEKF